MPEVRKNSLGQVVRLAFLLTLSVLLAASSTVAQNSPQVSLETSETLFTVLTAINTCGYDQELNISDPLRLQIRSEVARSVENTAGAQDVIGPMCLYYRQHQTSDPARDLSQYVSLALYLEAPPTFALKVKPSELPPDAAVGAQLCPLSRGPQRGWRCRGYLAHQRRYCRSHRGAPQVQWPPGQLSRRSLQLRSGRPSRGGTYRLLQRSRHDGDWDAGTHGRPEPCSHESLGHFGRAAAGRSRSHHAERHHTRHAHQPRSSRNRPGFPWASGGQSGILRRRPRGIVEGARADSRTACAPAQSHRRRSLNQGELERPGLG